MTNFDAISAILKEQRETKPKPKIEDFIPRYLDDNMKNIALDFSVYMQNTKMRFSWAGMANAWKANCKGKNICYMRLCVGYESEPKEAKWVVTPFLNHINVYLDVIMNEGLQDLVWDNLFYCKRCFAEKYPKGRPCSPGRNIIMLGKEVKGICQGRPPVWFWNPDETAINNIKRLLLLEKQARANKS